MREPRAAMRRSSRGDARRERSGEAPQTILHYDSKRPLSGAPAATHFIGDERHGMVRSQPHTGFPTSPHITGAAPRAPGGGDDNRSGTAVITKPKTRTKRPNLYRVLLLNDDYTPMEFVVHVLERFFNKSREDATRIMLHVHQNGVGECGVYTYEVAETKVTQVMDFARKHQHPLQCVMEKK
jgi:ATP-dependent Clp protease adaptor protein ClpS